MTKDDSDLGFPDAPRAALDRSLNELIEHAHTVLETQGRLRALLRADQSILNEPDLPMMLRRIVDAAVDLIGAQYGALGVIAPHGGLEQFIYVGMSAEQAEAIGHLPEGHGLLGALIEDPRPVRLEHLADDPRSEGFPSGHPPMDSFLGVPVRVGDEVFGNLYLTNQESTAFTADDEELAISLASTAGMAINNARLYFHARKREEWIAATGDLVTAILSENVDEPLQLVSACLAELAHVATADVFLRPAHGRSKRKGWSLLRPTGDNSVERAAGLDSEALDAAASSSGPGLLPLQSDDPHQPYGATATAGRTITVPLPGRAGATAVIVLKRPPEVAAFSTFDIDLIGIVCRQATLALQLAEERANRQRADLVDDRARIARDLHDLVIQQIYAAGLELQTVTGLVTSPDVLHRISRTIDTLDASISQIRNVVFALSTAPSEGTVPLRYRLFDLASELGSGLSRPPSVSFAGTVDIMVNGGLADDVVAVARESLTNIRRHSHARTASLSVSIVDDEVVVEVTDDGDGIGETKRRSGLSNLEQRAVRRGGRFSLKSDGDGTHVYWAAPLERPTRSP